MTTTLKIFLRDCRVDLSIGLYDVEKTKPQPVIINAELTVDCPDLSAPNLGIKSVVSYEPLRKFIVNELPRRPHTVLLESLADTILAFCFQDSRVQAVKLRVEKTTIFPETAGAGIELFRTR